jgi:hypothetical protein
MTRDFVRDKKNLQREQKSDVPGWLATFGYLVVLAIVIGIMAALIAGLMRMDRDRARVPAGAGPGTRFGRRSDATSEVGARAAGAAS